MISAAERRKSKQPSRSEASPHRASLPGIFKASALSKVPRSCIYHDDQRFGELNAILKTEGSTPSQITFRAEVSIPPHPLRPARTQTLHVPHNTALLKCAWNYRFGKAAKKQTNCRPAPRVKEDNSPFSLTVVGGRADSTIQGHWNARFERPPPPDGRCKFWNTVISIPPFRFAFAALTFLPSRSPLFVYLKLPYHFLGNATSKAAPLLEIADQLAANGIVVQNCTTP